jgi:hypothetical protein
MTIQASKLIESLQKLENDKALAYLAATSKPEIQIRDFVASEFYGQMIIARERTVNLVDQSKGKSKRVDLAVLNEKGEVVQIIEFKAMVSGDVHGEKDHSLLKDLDSDLKKIKGVCDDRLGVHMMVHIENPSFIPEDRARTVKYFKKFSAQSRKHKMTREEEAMKVVDYYKRITSENYKITSNHIKLGALWGAQVSITFFLIDPK